MASPAGILEHVLCIEMSGSFIDILRLSLPEFGRQWVYGFMIHMIASILH
jgi:hypothetical protein